MNKEIENLLKNNPDGYMTFDAGIAPVSDDLRGVLSKLDKEESIKWFYYGKVIINPIISSLPDHDLSYHDFLTVVITRDKIILTKTYNSTVILQPSPGKFTNKYYLEVSLSDVATMINQQEDNLKLIQIDTGDYINTIGIDSKAACENLITFEQVKK